MIRRISKHNDLRDIVRSCPSGVIDDIYAIEYYTQGNETVIQAVFTKVGSQLEVILPASDLELLTDGILMRRAYYRVSDSSYPDGYYNLEFVESTNVWLGDSNGGSVNPSYVTEDELSSTLSSYATQDWVSSQQFLTSENLPSDLATQSWVQSQGYLTASTIPSDIATEEWVRSYTYDRSTVDYVCEKATSNAIDWVQEQGYLTASTIPSDIATESWVLSQGYVTVGDLPSGLATQSWVESYTFDKSMIAALVGKARGDALSDAQEWVSSQQFATQSWVESYTYDKFTIGQIGEKAFVDAQDWVSSQQFATQSWTNNMIWYILAGEGGTDPYATEPYVNSAISDVQSWVESKNYVEASNFDGYMSSYMLEFATRSWVESYISDTLEDALEGDGDPVVRNDEMYLFVTETLSEYATQSWVQSQGYVSTTDLSSYATKSWVSSNYFEESKIWVGTYLEWLSLSAEARSGYTIALIKE